MLRRTGYIVGLLFVAACAAAYPLTWGQSTGVTYQHRGQEFFMSVAYGRCTVGRAVGSAENPSIAFERIPVNWLVTDELYAVRFQRGNSGTRALLFPLWLPATIVSLFMGWRWRRSRRQNSTGFPLDRRTIKSLNHST